MKPTIGRIVHYHDEHDGITYAAIVSGVYSGDSVRLAVIRESSLVMVDAKRQGETDGAGWLWPPRDDEAS